MTVTLTIKQVPAALARRLKQRAKANRRSLQGELLCIIEAAASQDASAVAEPVAPRYSRQLDPEPPSASKRAAGRAGEGASKPSTARRDAQSPAGRLRGRASTRMSTDEIMRLTRGA